MSRVIDEHRQYIEDEVRIEAFTRAIRERVGPGHVVLDLGSGTGIMALLACRAGAARVYSIEETAIVGLARELCRANGFGDRVQFIKSLSTHAAVPEPVDVVIADQVGRFGFEYGILQFFADARERFLRAGGTLVPAMVELRVAPVEAADLWSHVSFWRRSPLGLDFSAADRIATNTGYPWALQPAHLLGEASTGATLDLTCACPDPFTFEASLPVRRKGTLHGVGGWFVARLSPSVSMTNGPEGRPRIRRRNVVFPVQDPVEVEEGDVVRVRFDVRPLETVITWRVSVSRGETVRARSTHSTWHGMLICEEDLQRTTPDFVPRLTPRGEARRSVVDLCDGQRTVRDIEQMVYRRHPGLFHSPEEAAVFVTEVVTRYSQ